jgi:hypothetical protein
MDGRVGSRVTILSPKTRKTNKTDKILLKEYDMKATYWFGGAFLLVFTACSSNQDSYYSYNFTNMTSDELYVYNLDKAPLDQVVCEDRRRPASRIPRNVCMTVREIEKERAFELRKLNVINRPAVVTTHNEMRR